MSSEYMIDLSIMYRLGWMLSNYVMVLLKSHIFMTILCMVRGNTVLYESSGRLKV